MFSALDRKSNSSSGDLAAALSEWDIDGLSESAKRQLSRHSLSSGSTALVFADMEHVKALAALERSRDFLAKSPQPQGGDAVAAALAAAKEALGQCNTSNSAGRSPGETPKDVEVALKEALTAVKAEQQRAKQILGIVSMEGLAIAAPLVTANAVSEMLKQALEARMQALSNQAGQASDAAATLSKLSLTAPMEPPFSFDSCWDASGPGLGCKIADVETALHAERILRVAAESPASDVQLRAAILAAASCARLSGNTELAARLLNRAKSGAAEPSMGEEDTSTSKGVIENNEDVALLAGMEELLLSRSFSSAGSMDSSETSAAARLLRTLTSLKSRTGAVKCGKGSLC